MFIEGFAYTPNESDVYNKRITRLKEMNEIGFNHIIDSFSTLVKFTKTTFSGKLNAKYLYLSEEDLLILLDGGPCACFGGMCSIDRNTGMFNATIFTD